MKNLLSLLLCAAALCGCGLIKELQDGAVTARDGVWSTACYYGSTGPARDLLAFKGNDMSLSSTMYLDGSCNASWIGTKVTYSTYDGAASTTIPSAKEFDLTVLRVEIAAFDAGYAKLFSDQNYCGVSDWVAGQFRDVTGKTCGSTPILTAGSVSYDVYLVDKAAGTLLTGKRSAPNDGSTYYKRPRELDSIRLFRRTR